jgi:competence protein ComEC
MYLLRRQVHPTWLLTVACIGVLIGVTLSQWLSVFAQAAWLLTGMLLFVIALWRHRAYMYIAVLAAGMLVGLWRGSIEQAGLSNYRIAFGSNVIITGKISDDIDTNTRGQKVIRLTAIASNGVNYPGSLWVTSDTEDSFRRDDTVTVQGSLTDGFAGYVGAIYDAKVSNVERAPSWALDLRDTFSGAIRSNISEPMGSLGVGFLVGQKSALPKDFVDALKIAGLTHIVVASGYNLTILVRFARKLFEKISKFQAVFFSASLVVGFMAITGWSASMTRAGLVSGLGLLAWYYGRKFHPITLLAIAAATTTLWYPAYAWGNIGWELSFVAFAGVLILAPLLHAYFYADEKPKFVARTVIETISAQVVTLPIMLVAFGQGSIVAILSNLLVLPLVPLAMLLTFIAGLGQLLFAPIAAILAWPASVLLSYMVGVIKWTASFQWAQVSWQMPAWVAAMCYLVIVLVCFCLQRVTKYDLRQVNPVE